MKIKYPKTDYFFRKLKFLFKRRSAHFIYNKMSAIDNTEIGSTVEVDLSGDSLASNVLKTTKKREPKRVLHFSDGTLEEYDTDESEEELAHDGVEQPFRKAKDRALESEPPVDPKTLSWPSWIKHYTVEGGSKTLNAMDRIGENVAYYLGITTPKYQYEIDEYNRAREEQLASKKQEDIEIQSWVTSPNQVAPSEVITEEHRPSDNLPV